MLFSSRANLPVGLSVRGDMCRGKDGSAQSFWLCYHVYSQDEYIFVRNRGYGICLVLVFIMEMCLVLHSNVGMDMSLMISETLQKTLLIFIKYNLVGFFLAVFLLETLS